MVTATAVVLSSTRAIPKSPTWKKDAKRDEGILESHRGSEQVTSCTNEGRIKGLINVINWIWSACVLLPDSHGRWCKTAKLRVCWTSLRPALTVRCSTSRSLDVGGEFWWNVKDCENCPRQRRRIRRSYVWMYLNVCMNSFNSIFGFHWDVVSWCLLQLLIFMLLHLSWDLLAAKVHVWRFQISV